MPRATSPPPSRPETLSQALTDKIRELLTQAGWSQREFAKRLGVTQGAVSYLLAEKRRASALDYYERLAGIFGLTLSSLVADLEQRLDRHETDPEGQQHGRTAAHRLQLHGPASGPLDDAVFVRVLLDTIIDLKLNAAYSYIDAQVHAVAERGERHYRDTATPKKRRNGQAATTERADDHATGERAVRAAAGNGNALPDRRDSTGRDLRGVG